MRLLLALFLTFPLTAHDLITTPITWTVEISRLVNRHCLQCHGEKATVPLATYEQARPWAKAIRDQVMTREMPPWGAVAGFGPHQIGDPSLTRSEIDVIVRWVEGGAPEGEAIWLPKMVAADAPPVPTLKGPLAKIGCDWEVPKNVVLVGIRPAGLGPENQMRVIVSGRDRAVEPLIWIRGYPSKPHDFVFDKPVALTKGSVLHLESDVAADAELSLKPTSVSLRQQGKASRKQTPSCSAQ